MTPENLKSLMETHGLNVKRTAGYAEVSRSCVYMWLRGDRNIPKLQWANLQRKLNGSAGSIRLADQWEIVR